MDDLRARLRFVEEIDKLKSVLRRTRVIEEDRLENSAEHSWHVALMAVVLAGSSPDPIDLVKVVKMLLIHDVVEIDVGDTFAYDVKGHEGKVEREREAARRIFGLLPGPEAQELVELWEEYEEALSPEGAFAHSLDRFQPILLNYKTQGHAWKKHGISRSQVLERNSIIRKGCPALWPIVNEMVDEGVAKGQLVDG